MPKAILLAALMALLAGQAGAQQIDPALLRALSPSDISAIERKLGDGAADAAPTLPSTAPPEAAVQPLVAPDRAAAAPAAAPAAGVVQTYYRALTGETLPLHGRDLFLLDPQQGTFMFNSIGLDYRIAPGDQLRVVTRGLTPDDTVVPVDRDGTVTVAGVLPLPVSGLTIPEVRQTLTEALRIDDPSAEVALSLASARLVPVQVTGFVTAPQTLAIPAYTPLSVALALAGGVGPDGTLRSVRVFTPGQPAREVDLYGLVNGLPAFEDVLLTERARVHVAGIGPTVAVTGFAASAAIFELPRDQGAITVGDLLAQASVGRLPAGATLELLSLDGEGLPQRTPIDAPSTAVVTDGQALHIGFRGLRDLDRVELTGAVLDPRKAAYRPELTVADLLNGGAALRPEADPDVALIRNSLPEAEPRLINLRRALADPSSATLGPGDIVHVFTRTELSGMMARLASTEAPSEDPLFDGLRRAEPALVLLDSRPIAILPAGSLPEDSLRLNTYLRSVDLYANYAHRSVRTGGSAIRRTTAFDPRAEWFGTDPARLLPGERAQLFTIGFIRSFAGRLDAATDALTEVEDVVQDVVQVQASTVDQLIADDLQRVTGAVQYPGLYPFIGAVPLERALNAAGGLLSSADRTGVTVRQLTVRGSTLALDGARRLDLNRIDPAAYVLKGRFDVFVPDLANDAFIGTVQVQGEVRQPGEFAVSRGETLGDVIRRAGGLTSTAYPLGAVFTRSANQETERATYRRLADQIRQLVIGLSQAEREGAADQIAAVIAFADQIENAPVTGRQVVTLGAGSAAERIELAAGDRLIVPTRPSFVRIIGAVQAEVSTQHIEGRQAADYLADAGGTTELADLARAFLILPNGQSQPLNLRNAKSAPVPPGSVIVVPPKLDRLSPLALTEIVAGVLGNIATSILAFDTISGR